MQRLLKCVDNYEQLLISRYPQSPAFMLGNLAT